MKKLFSAFMIASVVALSSTAGALMPQTANAATNSCRYTNLNRGESGYCVRMAQTLLKGPFVRQTDGSAFTAALYTDSSFGPATQTAAFRWQRMHGLKYDGVVGPQTWRSLCGFGVGGGSISNTTTASRSFYNAAFDATC